MKSLVLVAVFIVHAWIPKVETIEPTQRPSLPALQNFKTKEGEYVNILQMIGAGYSSFGICLLNDKDGGMLNTIRVSNNYKVEPVVEEIFNRWLMIRGSSSGTWANMVECLHQAQLNYLASIIEAMYEYDTPTDFSCDEALENQVDNPETRNPISKQRNNYGLLNCNNITNSELDMTFVCTKDILECVIETSNARGLGIIITNDYSDTGSPLYGTCKDGNSLLETLVHSKFIVLWLHNIDRQTISDIMNEVKSLEKHAVSRAFVQKYECILFAFSGHGWNNKYIMMQDIKKVNIETAILEPLLPFSIKKFGEVPKVLLIDACRGELETATVSTKFQLDVITKDTIPAEGNYLLACATMPDHSSYMYRHGSAWMQEFASLAQKSTKSIEGVLVNVNEILTKRANRGEIEFQQPDMYVRLLREVHIYHDDEELVDYRDHTEL